MSSREAEAARIFLEAVEHHAPGQWAAFAREAAAEDPLLLQRVEALLRAHGEPNQMLDGNRLVPTADLPPPSEGPGTVIGAYMLLEQIGEGGFGVVFMAEQLEPIRRKVALKVLKPGMETKQVIARFEAERQALALMDHPNIAMVLDAGQTDSGRPYFVMELVKGLPLTEFCDQGQLTPRERLGLFVCVCQAVQHAHQKGIIHRDLKPSNVLVTLQDGAALVKVIDFGIAKALGQQLTDKTLCTGFAQLVGTPLYMSPEQAALSNVDVDTRSDIYSLGVLLYELLTGTTPFDKERFKEAGYDEIRRIISEEEPPRPSTRISTLGPAAATVAIRRQSDPKRLSQLFRGELDWIAMKCLEKDRNRRYETVSALAADVQHYLRDEPVQACPPSALYRFRKFARRNKQALVAAALLGTMLLVAVGAIAGSLGWAARDRAARRAVTEEKARGALEEAVELQGQKRWPEALEAVKRAGGILADLGSDELWQRVREQRADLEMVLHLEDIHLQGSDVQDSHFDESQKVPQYERAFREYGIDVARLGPQEAAARIRAKSIRLELAAALDEWTLVRRKAHQDDTGWRELLATARLADPDEWRNQLREALARPDPKLLQELAASDRTAGLPPATLALLGMALQKTGAIEQAAALLRQAQRWYPDDFWINAELAYTLIELKPPAWEEAVRFATAALALRPRNPGVLLNLGCALDGKGALDEAIAVYREALLLKSDYAMAYGNLAMVYVNLGNALRAQGKLPEAVDAYRKALELKPDFPMAYNGLGIALRAQGKWPEAVEAYRKALELKPDYAEAYNNLGAVFAYQRKLLAAVEAYRKALELKPDYAEAYNNLGLALQAQGKWAEAVEAYRKALELKPDHATAFYNLGTALGYQGKLPEAIEAYRKAIALQPKFATAFYNLGNALVYQGKLSEAIEAYRKAIALQPDYAMAHCNLGGVLRDQGQLSAALAELRRGHELGSRQRGWTHPSAQWVQEVERLIALDAKLPAVLREEAQPADAAEQLLLAQLCQKPYKRLYAAAAKLYSAAFAAQPRLAENVPAGHRYNAACAAALAGCGQGDAQPAPDEAQRGGWRQQACDWLRTDLAWWQKRAETDKPQDWAALRQTLRHWQDDGDLAGVRGEPALARLPPAEREPWRRLWADVAATLERAQEKTAPADRTKKEP
jgi:serine/threonine protein kinase/Flp pilus assembly protein TadD